MGGGRPERKWNLSWLGGKKLPIRNRRVTNLLRAAKQMMQVGRPGKAEGGGEREDGVWRKEGCRKRDRAAGRRGKWDDAGSSLLFPSAVFQEGTMKAVSSLVMSTHLGQQQLTEHLESRRCANHCPSLKQVFTSVDRSDLSRPHRQLNLKPGLKADLSDAKLLVAPSACPRRSHFPSST